MSNVHSFSTREDIHEQACVWVSRMDRGLSDAEQTELSQWAAKSNANREALFEVASLWDDMSVMHELSGLFPLNASNEAASAPVFRASRWQVAASIAFLFMAIGGIFSSSWQTTPEALAVAAQRASTQVGEQKNITLSDGSVVHLNTDSVVSIAYSDEERRITLLQGEAYFDVAHETTRPFVVAAGANTVTAVGTAFNVEIVEDASFELVVTEGRVLVQDRAVQRADEDAKILTGQRAIIDEGLLVFSGEKAIVKKAITQRQNVSSEYMEDDLAWQKGMLVFKGEPLDSVLEEITRYTPVHFQITDEALKSRRVAGYFKVGDIEALLSALENSFSIQHERVSELTILLSEGA